ncbi:MAG: BatA and WFA domain-containing protein [Planctomycetaceae bacterium]
MTLLNPALLAGLLLAAAPIVLHLLFKQKPKPLIFPALRLVQQRRKQNLKRIKLRHIWLLLLRVLAIGVLVLALTRPSLPAANYSLNTREWLTLAGVIVVAVVTYFVLLRRWRERQLPRHVFNLRRASARGYTTGATLLGLLLLVGCPYQQRIAGEITAPPEDIALDLPVATVFLFDTSLSMSYQQEGKTRLDVAREIAEEHISKLPAGSRVAIVDTA